MNKILEKFEKNEDLKRRKGEIHPKGLYIIYRFALIMSDLFILLAAVSFI